nr:molybdopterin-dependent oxidoreductase [Syntrophus gentianae]
MPNKKDKRYAPGYTPNRLSVSGLVSNPLSLRAEDLRQMEVIELRNLNLFCHTGLTNGIAEKYQGVLLRTLLDRAEILFKGDSSPDWIYITLASREGDGAIYFMNEIYNTPIGEYAFVIFEKKGNLLEQYRGEIGFISAIDYRPGPRLLRFLQRIEVHEFSGIVEQL